MVGRGVGGSTGRIVAQEVVLGELTLRGGGGRALGTFPGMDDTCGDETRRNHCTHFEGVSESSRFMPKALQAGPREVQPIC